MGNYIVLPIEPEESDDPQVKLKPPGGRSVVGNSQLRDYLASHFNIDELNDLAFRLGINYESLGGDTVEVRAMYLVLYAARRGLTDDLDMLAHSLRPDAGS